MPLYLTHLRRSMMTKLEIGNLLWNDRHTMPILELVNGGKTVYLTPFRWYKFQVSQTLDGEWDLGSSCQIRFENFSSLSVENFTNLMISLAYAAICDYCARNDAVPPRITEDFMNFVLESINAFSKKR